MQRHINATTGASFHAIYYHLVIMNVNDAYGVNWQQKWQQEKRPYTPARSPHSSLAPSCLAYRQRCPNASIPHASGVYGLIVVKNARYYPA
jgi:hypothetical protein